MADRIEQTALPAEGHAQGAPQLTVVHLVAMVAGVFVVGFAAVLLLMGRGTRLTPEMPTARVDDILLLQVPVGESGRVRAEALPPAEWTAAAREGIPNHLTAASALYTISGPVEAVFTLPDPTAAYDLYRWDSRAEAWQFVPITREPQFGRLVAEAPDGPVALFEVGELPALLSTRLAEGETLSAARAVALNTLLYDAYTIGEEGEITQLDAPAEAGSVQLVPVVHAQTPEAASALLEGRAVSRELADLLAESGYPAVVFDLGPLSEEQSEALASLINELSDDLRAGVWLHNSEGLTETLGTAADAVYLPVIAPPDAFRPGGEVDALLQQATSIAARDKLHVVVTARSLDVWAGQVTPIGYDYALAPLGDVGYLPESRAAARSPQPGDPLGFILDGEAQNVRLEEGALRYSVIAGDGEHDIWVTTGASLRAQLDYLSTYEVGGLLVQHLLSEDISPSMTDALQSFKAAQPNGVTPDFTLTWRVSEVNGPVLTEATTTLTEAHVWVPEAEGEYMITAELLAEGLPLERVGQAVLVSGETVGTVPEFEGVVVGAPDLQEAETDTAENPTLPPLDLDLPPPVVRPSAPGIFELGGQVNHVIYHPGRMQEASMEWVKFQIAWEENMSADVVLPAIQQADEHGFKVLLSITGQVKYPDDINYDAYIDFLRGVAYYGPDAIEIWNEGNLAFEWPRGEIDGVTYVEEMLAPGYNAIKRVNPNIMVISGALAPTGAFFAEGGCSEEGSGCDDWIYLQQMARAGAANYIDCVGVHFNAGATSPYAREGHPADPGYQHYSWYFGSMVELYGGTFGRPLCFTELGYLSGDGYGSVPSRFSWASDTSVAEQAQWLAEAAAYSRELGSVRMMIVWNVDFVYWGDDPMAGYAIIRPDGSCPACAALAGVMN